jgi:steroid delta-isomerase-like uncharacterized protein
MEATMTPKQNKEVVERYLQRAWGDGDWATAEEIVDENIIFHDQVREGDLPPGRDGLRTAMERISQGIPDFVMEIHEMVAEGDIVVIRWSATGTHAGDFNGFPATGRVVTLDAISIVRMKDGHIVEGWQEADRLGLGQQLGMVPKSAMPRPVAQLMASSIRLRDRWSRWRMRKEPAAAAS